MQWKGKTTGVCVCEQSEKGKIQNKEQRKIILKGEIYFKN